MRGNKRNTKKTWGKKKIGIVLSGMLLLLSVGATYASGGGSLSLTNEVKTPKVSGKIVEVFDENTIKIPWADTVPKEVSFKNEGTVDVFLRVTFGDNWTNGGSYFSNTYLEKEVAEIVWTGDWDSEWMQDDSDPDGWYYYKKVLKPGDSTKDVMTDVYFNKVNVEPYLSSGYHLTFRMEMVQASKDKAVSEAAVKALFDRNLEIGTGDWNEGEAVLSFTSPS